MRKSGILSCVALSALLICSVSGAVGQERTPDGTFTMSSTSIALGIGVSWGSGTLKHDGKDYPFKVSGLSIVDLGVSSASVAGEVFDLKKIEDFPGKYVSFEASATLAGGAGVITAKNANGVVIHARSTSQGAQLTLAPTGLTITLE